MIADTQPQGGEAGRWYLVRTKPNREIAACCQLERQGFFAYLPKTMRTVSHARKLTNRTAAFFPGYLFVRLDLGRDRWRSVNGTIGVSHIVMMGERPACVPTGVVEDLIASSDALGLHAPPLPGPGEKVRILSGPFSGQVARVQRLDGAGRVRLLLDIMGGEIPIDTSGYQMVAA